MMQKNSLLQILLWITAFSIAMGYLESAVVVYLRKIMYPEGFGFPLVPISKDLALTEIFREVATMIMLAGAGYIAGRNRTERVAWFLYCFAIWDIFYYVFLKILISWPESLMTWDILFLIPVTWVGPVISPIIVSCTMILFTIIILYFSYHAEVVKIKPLEWWLYVTGSLTLIVSFTWDYSGYILEHYSFYKVWTIPDKDLYDLAQHYIPRKFNWWLFCLGEAIIISGIANMYVRSVAVFKRKGR